jgi:hypothetical protein
MAIHRVVRFRPAYSWRGRDMASNHLYAGPNHRRTCDLRWPYAPSISSAPPPSPEAIEAYGIARRERVRRPQAACRAGRRVEEEAREIVAAQRMRRSGVVPLSGMSEAQRAT